MLFTCGVMLASIGCGGGTTSNGGSTTYTLGGTVAGLGADQNVSLQDNGGSTLTLSGNGAFSFPMSLDTGSAYAVTVKSHTPGIACTVSNGSGTVGSSNVTGLAVSCAAGTERILYSFGNTFGNTGKYGGKYGDMIHIPPFPSPTAMRPRPGWCTHSLLVPSKVKGDAAGSYGGRQTRALTALLTPRHDGRVQALAEAGRQIVDLVGAVDLDGLASGGEGDFAMLAAMQMLLQFGAGLDGHFVVDQVVEQSQKFGAGHFSAPFLRRKYRLRRSRS